MAKTVRIRFLVDRTTREAEPQTYVQGQEYDVSPESAGCFVRRGQAEIVETGKGKKAEKSEAAE